MALPAIFPTLLLLMQANPPPAFESHAQSLSGDGKLFAYSLNDGTVHVLSLPEGKALALASGFSRGVDGLTFSPDSKEVAAVAVDGSLRIVASADGKLLAEFGPPPSVMPSSARAMTVDYLEGGTKLLLAGGQTKARLVERPTGTVVREFALASGDKPDGQAAISASALSADGRHFALGDEAGRFAVCSTKTGDFETGPFRGPKNVQSLAFDPAGKRLAVGADNCIARVYPLDPFGSPQELSHCDQNLFGDLSICSVCFSADGKSLLTASFSFWEVRLWDLETGKPRWAFDYGGGNPWGIQARFTPDGSRVIVSKGGVRLASASGTAQSPLVREMMTDFRISGQFAWTTSASKFEIYDVAEYKLVCELPLAAK